MAKIAEQAERYDGMLFFSLSLFFSYVCVFVCGCAYHFTSSPPTHIPESPYFNLRDMSLDLY